MSFRYIWQALLTKITPKSPQSMAASRDQSRITPNGTVRPTRVNPHDPSLRVRAQHRVITRTMSRQHGSFHCGLAPESTTACAIVSGIPKGRWQPVRNDLMPQIALRSAGGRRRATRKAGSECLVSTGSFSQVLNNYPMATSNSTGSSFSVATNGLLENEENSIQHRLFQLTLVPSLQPLKYIVAQMVKGKDPKENPIEYFGRINPKNVKFTKTQRDIISSDPSCGSYDITLCFKIIQEYCDKVKPQNDPAWTTPGDTLEYYIKEIKNKRNDFIHEVYRGDKTKFYTIVHDMKCLLTKTWVKIAQTFGTDILANILIMKTDIEKIKDAPFEGSRVYLSELQATMLSHGVASMKKKYVEILSSIPDVHFQDTYKNLGARSEVKVLEVFTEMQIVNKERREEVTMDEWLTELEKIHAMQNKRSRFLLVEGVAGVGKTTLIRKLVLDWASGNSTIPGLDDFQLLIYMQFRDQHINSMSLLCTYVMPYMKEIVDPEYLMMLTEGSNIIFVCDGLDENNPLSIQLFKEILDYGANTPLTVVCTTRPQEIDNLLFMLPDQFSCLHLQVLGIPETKRPSFIKRYMEAQKPDTDPQSLLDYLNRTSTRVQEYLRFPYNLMCLVMLWIHNPERINSLTTATELFMETLKETQKKLQTRLWTLAKGPQLSELPKSMDDIMDTLYDMALVHHGSGDIILTEDSVQLLKNECSRLNLAWNEISSAFFIQNITSVKEETSYSFPHNGLQDFYAAMSILKKVEDHTVDIKKTTTDVRAVLLCNHCSQDQISFILEKVNEVLDSPMPTRSLGSIFQEIAKEDRPDFRTDLIRRSRNILTHLTGILHYRNTAFTEERAEELFLLLKESGIQDTEHWLDLLELTRFDKELCRLIAQQISVGKSLTVTDSRTGAYTSLLPCIKKKNVNIRIFIEREPKEVVHLEELLRRVQEKQWMLRLLLQHEFRLPKPGGSSLDGALKQLRCSMYRFQGQVSLALLETLSNTLRDLHLSVADTEQYLALSHYLSAATSHLPLLENFRMHIPACTVGTELLQPLPKGLTLQLIISKVDGDALTWACRAASALQPEGRRYQFLAVSGAGSSAQVCGRLLEGLARGGVRMAEDAYLVVAPKLARADLARLQAGFEGRFGCRFRAWRGSSIWTYKC
ncbi:uncharacterized protein [Penaeus vannamei]|uniref:uncharacterized protein n=1 Tax=Penaeus vannamei TaxID=6689 RepID=UPI00387F65B6